MEQWLMSIPKVTEIRSPRAQDQVCDPDFRLDLELYAKAKPNWKSGLCHDLILFVCVCMVQETKRQRDLLMAVAWYSKYVAAVPALEGAVNQSGSINLSAEPSKKKKRALKPLGSKSGHWQEHRVPGVSQQALNKHSRTLKCKIPRMYISFTTNAY